jgi:hypothetical protein
MQDRNTYKDIVLMSNRGDFFKYDFLNRVAAVYLAEQMKPEPANMERIFIAVDPAATKKFQGVYRVGKRRFEVIQRASNLLISDFGWSSEELKPITPNRFYCSDGQYEVEFTTQPPSGMGAKITLKDGGVLSGKRITLPAFGAGDMPAYPGRYWSEELQAQWTIVLRNGNLFAEIARNSWQLRPIAKDEFAWLSWFSAKFIRDGQGLVTGMLLSNRQTTGVRFSRFDPQKQ